MGSMENIPAVRTRGFLQLGDSERRVEYLCRLTATISHYKSELGFVRRDVWNNE